MEMGRPYPRELRERVLDACATRMTQPEVAELYGVGRTTIVKWLMLQRETGDIEPRGHGGGVSEFSCMTQPQVIPAGIRPSK